MGQLKKAQKSIKAAIAWINFEQYGVVLEELLDRGVKIKILLNNDGINQRYSNAIQYLNDKGAKIRLVHFAGIMHHKFCIIDKCICMFGSFNWTKPANLKNIEDLNICNDYNVVANYLLEFTAIWDLSKEDIKLLANPINCESCGEPIINILIMQQEGYDQTKIEVVQLCECIQKIVYTDYYDASLYNNYMGTIQQFNDYIVESRDSGDEISYHKLIAQQDFVVKNYFSLFRYDRMGMPIIHAVGVKTWKWLDKREETFIYKIIWKERGTSTYIRDEYEIQ